MYSILLGNPRYCIQRWKEHSERRLRSLFKGFNFTNEKFLKSLGHTISQTFPTLNWNWIPLISWSSLWNSASFSVGQPKSAIKLELSNWPPWITASAKNSIPNWPSWSSLNYFPFACPASFKEQKELGLQTSLVYCLHTFKKILFHCANLVSLDLLLSVRNSSRKSPFCWLNLHL